MRYFPLFFLPFCSYGLQVNEWVKILRETHPYYDQTGRVEAISATGATIDYDGDGFHESGGGISLSTEGTNWEVVPDPSGLITPTFEKDDEVQLIGTSNIYPVPFLGRFVIGETMGHTSQIMQVEAILSDGSKPVVPNYEPFTDVLRLWEDADGDGSHDDDDDFPNDENETTDTDGDGIGNNEDTDDDGDSIFDDNDQFPEGGDGNINTGGQSTTIDPNGILTGYIGNIDTDNDVPTLLQILARLDTLNSTNAGILESNTPEDLPVHEFDRNDIEYKDENDIPPGTLPTEGISSLFSGAGGSMPNTQIQLESHSIDIDLQDTRYDTLFLIAKVGLTSLVVVGSVMATWKLGGSMLAA